MKSHPLLAIAVLLSLALPAEADTLAYTTPPAGSGTENDFGAYGISGIEFTLNENIAVTQLGFNALSLGGDTPQVTVWQVGTGGALTPLYTTGNLIGSVTSNPANSDAAAFSYVPVSGTLDLSSGDTYLVTAPAYWAATYDSSNVTTAGGGVFSSTSFLKGGAWGDWNNSTYLGDTPNLSSFSLASGADTPAEANFQFTVDASESVPEPSSYAMLAGGLALLALVLRRRAATR